VLIVGGCNHSKRRAEPPPVHRQSFLALDAEQQKLVRDYQPVSRALTAYELAYRDWRAGRLKRLRVPFDATVFRKTVVIALARIRRDSATGETAHAKTRLVAALEARQRALAAPPGSKRYREEWDRSVVKARRGLTLLQDIRDRARLIPLPEDSVS
jgi:hypothetical protein